MKRAMKQGFTLVEILIVVIILGILAAIVIPQFTEASRDARESNLMTNLQTIRSQMLLYKTQHLEDYPDGADSDAVIEQLTQYTDNEGNTSATPDDDHPYGPYVQSMPSNPISGDNSLRVVSDASAEFSAPADDGGWYYNSATGEFRADLKDSHLAADGETKLNEL